VDLMTMVPDQPNELVLKESRTMRAQTAGRVDVLDKVKALALLPDGVHATIEIVAGFFESTVDAIEKIVQRNRKELEENGYMVLRGAEYRSFAADNLSAANPKTRTAALFTRRTILNVGQLLTESDVARQVRTYLLEIEEAAAPEARVEAADLVALSEARMRVLKAAEGIVDNAWLETKARLVVAKALGEEPEVDPLDVPLYVPDFLKSLGLKRKDVESVQSWFGRFAVEISAELGIEPPQERQSELPNGTVRKTKAWTERHRPVFELTWARKYAAKYPTQLGLDGAA
jgi:hypothetical protein